MSKQTNKQSGFAHLMLVAVIVLSLGLVGSLGYIFWQNFMQKKEVVKTANANNKSNVSNSTSSNDRVNNQFADWNTYTNSTYDFSFKYPKDFTVQTSSDGMGYGISVKNASGKDVFSVSISPQQVPYGLENNYRVITYKATVDHSKKIILSNRVLTREATDTPNGGFYLFIDFSYSDEYYHLGSYNEDVNQSAYLDQIANQIISTWIFN